MNDFNDPFATSLEQPPKKLIPVLIGALAMTATSAIPFISLINCLCCAGIMGGAVLGVWFYKKGFPPGLPFTIGNGALVGTLSGLIAGGLMALITSLQAGLFSGDFAERLLPQLEEGLQKGNADPATTTEIMNLFTSLAEQPAVLFALILFISVLVFTAFGALGGVIGGNIFKTRVVVPPQNTPFNPPR